MGLTSSSTITVSSSTSMGTTAQVPVLPALAYPYGKGRIAHPLLGVFDYTEKPDQWVNIDSDIIIPPVWTSVRTLTSSANVLWAGNIRDVEAEERWNQPLAMSIGQFRMLSYIYSNPVDPTTGYVQWFPNYINNLGYNVIPTSLTVGGQSSFVFDDIVNTRDLSGNIDGWITNPVVLKLRMVSKIS